MHCFRRPVACAVLFLGIGLAAQGSAVVINEIHHSPDIKQERVEFVELFNPGPETATLTGWRLEDAVSYSFPAGVSLSPGQFLVVAGDPAAVERKFQISGVSGPWSGNLSGGGERLRLRDGAGGLVDEVDYGSGFPWPTVGDPPGYSIELIHSDLDNALGGNWRASVLGTIGTTVERFFEAGSTWNYWKGTVVPSTPASGWREPDFDDATWPRGGSPIGYDPDIAIATPLGDMRNGYSQFFLRRTFQVNEASRVTALRLEALFDDGFKLWVNGTPVFSSAMPDGEVALGDVASGSARENNNFQRFEAPIPPGVLREGRNVVAVQVANISLGSSSDAFFDARLAGIVGPTGRGPSPGRTNVVDAIHAPPAVRQVVHLPNQPRSGDPVRITARITDPDGVDSVELQYQVVEPGRYVELDDPEFMNGWQSVAMIPDSSEQGLYAANLPLSVVRHRNLIRYRIAARDRLGNTGLSPRTDEPEPNFALFCHDGVPAWSGAVRPEAAGPLGNVFTVDSREMNRLPVYHLIARKEAVEASTWRDRSHGDEYFWTGTLVYDGEVYDHVRFRPRGGVWRYAMGKNMWKFDFNRGHEFRARDNWGRRFSTTWSKLNLGASIQQGNYNHRGEQGMFESVGFRLFQLAGVPASHSTFVQFRIVDAQEESLAANQYEGDFWGVYLAVEQLDGRFLDEHGLSDGNLFKMEGGFGEPNNLGPAGPVDSSDLRAFIDHAYPASNADLPDVWWRTNLNLEAYFSYQTVVQGIHHYDIADGKNFFYYRNPEDGRWTVLPWDLDLTWANNMYRSGVTGGDEPFKSRVLSNFGSTPARPDLAREFRNRVREIRDLLWNGDEAFRLIDEYALRLKGTAATTLLDADRAQWDYNPVMTNTSLVNLDKAGQGRFYTFPGEPGVPRSFEGAVQLMKNYVLYRATNGGFSLDTLAEEPGIPSTPMITDAGPTSHPLNRLDLGIGPYQGESPFQSVQWRVAEISRPGHPATGTREPMHYEIESVWQSPRLPSLDTRFRIPGDVLRVGHLYRARARFMDAAGRSSHWSNPVEFTVGEPEGSADLVRDLALTEVMYNPPPGGFEFVELHNRSGTGTLALEGVAFTDGIDFVFPSGSRLGPGGYAVLIRSSDVAGFRVWHGLDDGVPVYGPYSGALDNGGERLAIQTAVGGAEILELNYRDSAPWPIAADGAGYSLVPRTGGPARLDDPSHWRASTALGGSPGRSDPESVPRARAYSISEDGLEIVFDGEPALTWSLEISEGLDSWRHASDHMGPATITVPIGEDSPTRFFRAVPRVP
ncbi:MAG: lamin tail domain-containing protein [Verrucomicrobiales bacterium]|nr:lamin tail domain-containing protein [Verrucomicrobiales bacterium]